MDKNIVDHSTVDVCSEYSVENRTLLSEIVHLSFPHFYSLIHKLYFHFYYLTVSLCDSASTSRNEVGLLRTQKLQSPLLRTLRKNWIRYGWMATVVVMCNLHFNMSFYRVT